MGNALFCYPDYLLGSSIYAAALSGGSWAADLPLANLQDPLRSKVTRSSDAEAASTVFDIDLGVTRALRLLAVLNTNLSTAATVRFAIYVDAAHSQLLYDTEALPVSWKDVDAETLAGWRPDFWVALPEEITGRYVRVEIQDVDNPDGYVELGRCLMMPGWEPETNFAYGAAIHYDHSATVIDQALSGVRYADRHQPLRSQRITYPVLGNDEACRRVLEMQRRLGRDGELFFVHDPDTDDFFARQKSFLATMNEVNALEEPYFDNSTTVFDLLEVP